MDGPRNRTNSGRKMGTKWIEKTVHEGHYNNQCLVKAIEKQPAVNMVTSEVAGVQQVTTQAKGKTAESETQEVLRRTTQRWVEKTNQQNAE